MKKAADDANLNVTERLALNHKFFAKGGGFELFPQHIQVPQLNHFYNSSTDNFDDSFTKEVAKLEIPEHISRIKNNFKKSSKGNFQTNLDNALKKLKKVLDNNI